MNFELWEPIKLTKWYFKKIIILLSQYIKLNFKKLGEIIHFASKNVGIISPIKMR